MEEVCGMLPLCFTYLAFSNNVQEFSLKQLQLISNE